MAVEVNFAMLGNISAHRKLLQLAFGVPAGDDKSTGTKIFNFDSDDGGTTTFKLNFHARTKTHSYNPHQACQPLLIFVNQPCSYGAEEQLSDLNNYLNEHKRLKQTSEEREDVVKTGLVTLYLSLPTEGKDRQLSLEDERAWVRENLLIDDDKFFELANNQAWLDELPRIYKYVRRVHALSDRAKGAARNEAQQSAADTADYVQSRGGTVYEGYIIKQGGFRHNWKKRWLVLDPKGFRYYKTTDTKLHLDQDSATPPDALRLRRSVAIKKVTGARRIVVPSDVPSALTEYSFLAIDTELDDDRVFVMCCATAQEAAIWEDRFQEVMASQ
eukprot:m.23090 g.23090  ORF g.23090 m.23090 type:complete len:329 (-) comp11335_c0_seq1:126-1112(-)